MKKILFLFTLLFCFTAVAQDSTATKLVVGNRTFLIPRLASVAGGGGGATDLVGLSDVSLATPTSGFALLANGTTFASRALLEADISDLQAYLTAEVDGSVSNELQTVDVFGLNGNVLELSLVSDGQATLTTDLSGFLDNTDNQTAAQVPNTPSGNLIATDVQAALNEIQTEVDGLAIGGDGLGPDGDKGEVTVGGGGTTLTIDNDVITTGKIANSTIDILDLDAQLQTDIGLAATALQSEVDGSTTNEIQTLSLLSNNLSLSLGGGSVSLVPYVPLTAEQVTDYVGGMVTGNTETLISVVFEDTDNTLDFSVSSDLSLYSTASVITFANTTASTTKDNGGVVMQGGLGVEKDINAGGDITAFQTSDERLKKNVRPITNAVKKVNNLSGNYYRWNGLADHILGRTGKDVGVLAQEVEGVIPEAVREGSSGFLQVNYDKIVPLLIEAIKEQDREIQELKKTLRKIKKAL